MLELLRFLEWIMALPDNLEIEYDRSLEAIEGETKMPYVLRRERLGIEKGRVEGREEGALKMLRESVLDILEVKFQDVPETISEKLTALEDQEHLRSLRRLAATSESLEAFEAQADL